MERKKEVEEYAKLESIVDDQGGGMSYCGSCHTTLEIQSIFIQKNDEKDQIYLIYKDGNWVKIEDAACTECHKKFEWTKPYVESGGSDF